jgi:type 1 glutamine amidotransferase
MNSRKVAQLFAGFCALAALSVATIVVRAQQAPPATPPQGAPPAGAPGAPGALGGRGGRGPQITRPQGNFMPQQIVPAWPWDIVAMEDALPTKAIATPKQPRKILVLCKASGFVHSNIPLAAETLKQMGEKTGAWTATITYDPADINTDNLKQYDLVFLDNTTGQFLDDPNDTTATAARRQALLDFVRSGKGLAGLHATVDSYHAAAGGPAAVAAGASSAAAAPPAGGGRGEAAQQVGTWPDYNKMIGGFFKFHWTYPQIITVKIDDPKSPLTAMFHGQEFDIHDETYTFAQDSFSRKNVHVLTSIDYSKMSDADKAKEPAATKRTDGDYALSWIRREGKGRVFIEVHGHDEHVYQMPTMLEHILAGTQYALGDLKADDSPSEK